MTDSFASKMRLIEGVSTKSEKIRRLAEADYSRQEIADFLGVRYQFVYNVLAADEKKRILAEAEEQKKRGEAAAGMAESAPIWSANVPPLEPASVKIGRDGTATIPA